MSDLENNRIEAEELRVVAEEGRVIAEVGRAHAESNEGSGRQEAEVIRVDAETERERTHLKYLNELKKLQDDPEHYITPGATSAFNRYRDKAIAGYIILAVATTIGIYAISNNAKEDLKSKINTFATVSCLASRQKDSPVNKFNDLIDLQIQSNRDARQLNLARGDIKRANINTKIIIRLQGNRIPVPSARECQAEIIK